MKPLLLAISLVLVSAPVADASVFRGKTSQDRRAAVETNAKRFPVRVEIRWRANCTGNSYFVSGTKHLPPFDERTRTSVRDEGSYTQYTNDGEKMRIHTWVRANRVTRRRWRGSFGARIVARRDGRVTARCSTGTIRWRASR